MTSPFEKHRETLEVHETMMDRRAAGSPSRSIC